MKKISIIIILFAFLGCTKFGKNVTVKGKVVNPITGVGISGVTLNLQRTTAGLPGGYKTVKSTTTDANGDFEISKFGLNRYELQCDIVDYYPIGWYEDGEKANGTLYRLNVRKRKTMHVDFHAVEYGNLIINFKNISCFNSSDKIQFYFDGEQVDSKTWIPGLLTELDGCIDIPGTPIKMSMGEKYFHWVVTKNAIMNTFYDTIYVSANTNTTLQVNY